MGQSWVFHDVAVGTARVYSWGENLDQGCSGMNEALALLKDIMGNELRKQDKLTKEDFDDLVF